jgi:hypothetical protein
MRRDSRRPPAYFQAFEDCQFAARAILRAARFVDRRNKTSLAIELPLLGCPEAPLHRRFRRDGQCRSERSDACRLKWIWLPDRTGHQRRDQSRRLVYISDCFAACGDPPDRDYIGCCTQIDDPLSRFPRLRILAVDGSASSSFTQRQTSQRSVSSTFRSKRHGRPSRVIRRRRCPRSCCRRRSRSASEGLP